MCLLEMRMKEVRIRRDAENRFGRRKNIGYVGSKHSSYPTTAGCKPSKPMFSCGVWVHIISVLS
jgi:hypothetical protein